MESDQINKSGIYLSKRNSKNHTYITSGFKSLKIMLTGKIFITSSTVPRWTIRLNNIVINYFTELLLQMKTCLHGNYPTIHAVTSVMKGKLLTIA